MQVGYTPKGMYVCSRFYREWGQETENVSVLDGNVQVICKGHQLYSPVAAEWTLEEFNVSKGSNDYNF